MAVQALNNAWGQLSTAMSSQTTVLTLQAGQSARFPVLIGTADWFYVTIFDGLGNVEIVKVTATQGDQFTVVRGQDSTSAMNWAAAVRVQLNLCAGFWNDYLNDVAAYAASARQFAFPINLSGAPTVPLQAATRKYVTDNILPKSQAIQAPIGFSPVKAGSANTIYFGWNGSDCLAQVDSTYLGNVWRDSTYSVNGKANGGAQLQYNSGVVQLGGMDWTNPATQTIDTGSPWVMEGYTAQLSEDGSGGITANAVYARVVWMRNQ